MKKLNMKKMMFSLSALTVTLAGVIFFSQSGGATSPVTEDNMALTIDKLDKDTLKLSLSNVIEVPKALQFSIQLDGAVYFNEESLTWLVTNTTDSEVQKNMRVSDDKKTLEFLIVSNEPLKKSGGSIEIGEIDIVSANNKAVEYQLTSKLQPDGTGYKYVVDATNRQVSGPQLYVENGGMLTYNTAPNLTLIDSPKIVEGKIMLTVGDTFTEKEKLSYVVATDEEDDNLTITVEGEIDTSVIGSYSLTYKVTDSLNETSTLVVPVIVENQVEAALNPVITGVRQQVELIVGNSFDVLEGIEAIDHTGYRIEVQVTGDYTETIVDGVASKEGIFTIQYDAEDRWGNPAASETTTLIVSQQPETPEQPDQPDVTIPESIVDLIDTNVVSVEGGKGTESEPLKLEVLNSVDVAKLKAMIEAFVDYEVKVERQSKRATVSYAITLSNDKETHYLVMKVSENQQDIIHYLDSLIDGATTPDNQPGTGNGGSDIITPDNQPGTGNGESDITTPDNQPGTGNGGSDTTTPDNQPETGLKAELSFIICGGLAIVVGLCLLWKRKVVKK